MALQPRLIACGKSNAIFGILLHFLTGPGVMEVASIAAALRGLILCIAIVQVRSYLFDLIIACFSLSLLASMC